MAKVLRQVSLFNGTKLITNMPKFITLNCHIFTNASGQLEFQFKNMKLIFYKFQIHTLENCFTWTLYKSINFTKSRILAV